MLTRANLLSIALQFSGAAKSSWALTLLCPQAFKVWQCPVSDQSGKTNTSPSGSPTKTRTLDTLHSSLSLTREKLLVRDFPSQSHQDGLAWGKGCCSLYDTGFFPISIWLFLTLSLPGILWLLISFWNSHKGPSVRILLLSQCFSGGGRRKQGLVLPILLSCWCHSWRIF